MHSQDVLTISELTRRIKCHMEAAFPFLKVQGEISNFKKQSSGHLYFSLKDQNAQVSAVMFRQQAEQLLYLPKDGDKIIIEGEMNVYPQGGRYQIIVKKMEQTGLGELLLKLEELKVKLHKFGWFSPKHKKPLPKFPKKIGVVTSPTGAAIQDVLNILTRRFSGFHLILYPVKVQGEGSAKEIARAIEEMNRYKLVDVMIVGRGGGSIEDLYAFNEEIVASAIFLSEIPVISAVGHETDHCIADYVADVRAPTPSAAAEIVIGEKELQIKQLNQLQHRISREMQHKITQWKSRLDGIKKHPLFLSSYALLGSWMQKTDDFKNAVDQLIMQTTRAKKQLLLGRKQHAGAMNPLSKITQKKQQLTQIQKSLNGSLINSLINTNKLLREKQTVFHLACQQKLENRKLAFSVETKKNQLKNIFQNQIERMEDSLSHVIKNLGLVDPKNLLSKGYSILFSEKNHSVITSIQDIEEDNAFIAQLADGKLIANLKEKNRIDLFRN